MDPSRIVAFVLAGGEGRRLHPLTDEQPKPALEVAAGCRIVDFVLSNLVNSGVRWIYLLAQYKPAPLIAHVARVWRPALVRRGCTVRVLVPEPPSGAYRGTAHAVHCNLHVLAEHEPDSVAVFAADHVYRMDLRPMLELHAQRRADVTVAAAPMALEEARRFGVLSAGIDGRVSDFQEKPAHPAPMRHDPHRALASMGNYLFDPIVLFDLLEDCVAHGGNDFGHDVLPAAVRSGLRVFAYDFSANRVPGLKPHEEAAYWRDVGTLDALEAARRDVAGPTPRLEPRNREWPLCPALGPLVGQDQDRPRRSEELA
jgi:glucose-1-phosphate adenylyltransferase